jgi:hypothetical protein
MMEGVSLQTPMKFVLTKLRFSHEIALFIIAAVVRCVDASLTPVTAPVAPA